MNNSQQKNWAKFSLMNKTLEAFARKTLKENLSSLDESNHHMFKLMYGREKGQTVDINEVVDNMPAEKLSWAMTQVDNTIANKKKLAERKTTCTPELIEQFTDLPETSGDLEIK